MGTWEDLKVVLAGLRDDGGGALLGFPTPEVDKGRTPPFHIRLASWATDVAADLHARFGDEVSLTVGSLQFPDRTDRDYDGTLRQPRTVKRAPLIPSNEFDVWIEEGLEVRSGLDLWSELGVRNKGPETVMVTTNGQVTARIVDPETDEVVGGFSGAQTMQAVSFRAPPDGAISIPLLIGTSSSVSRLGYVIPPGHWAIEVDLDVYDRGRLRTPLFPVSVVA
jgi:hypothetical protein